MSKLFKTSSKVLSSPVVVRPHVSWRSRFLVFFMGGIFLIALSWGMYEAGSKSATPRNITPQEKLKQLYDSGTCSVKDRKELCSQLASLIQQLQINMTTSKNLARQVNSLGTENNHLKEELAFFQHLMSDNDKINNDVSIYNFSLKKGPSPGIYSYAISLVQGGRRPTEFSGNLEFLVTLQQNKKSKTVPLANKKNGKNFPIRFKFFHKIEENFGVPSDAVVESIQVQVFKEGNAKAILTQTIKPAL